MQKGCVSPNAMWLIPSSLKTSSEIWCVNFIPDFFEIDALPVTSLDKIINF
jgi:hypothetical protein